MNGSNGVSGLTLLTGNGIGAGLNVDPTTATTTGTGLVPNGIAVDGAGRVLLADNASKNLLRYTGATPAIIATGFSTPSGVTVDGAGNIFVADSAANTLTEVPATGTKFTFATLTGRQGIVEIDHPERLLPLGWKRTATGMLAYGPRPGRLSVIEFGRPPGTRDPHRDPLYQERGEREERGERDQERDAPVTSAELEASLRRVSGADVRITALRSATRWTDNARQASTYQRGRVLLCGDAAHIHSPFGGQGLNLGLVDATNLGWKLAATVRGNAPAGLLDTYTTERHPVAASVLENTRAQLALMRPDPQTSALRQIMADLLTTYPDVNRHLGEMVSGVATRYDLGDEDPLVGRLVADCDLLVDGVTTRLFSLMREGNAVLIDGGIPLDMTEANVRVRVVKAAGARSMLIRPDGCIAWAGRAGGLRAALQRWL